MLFLNAGYINVGEFRNLGDKEVQESMMINAMQPVYTMKVLID